MTLVEILEKSKAFLEANAWGQTVDRAEEKGAPDGFKYCAQGAIAYGAFGGAGYCVSQAYFHEGDCDLDEYDDCLRESSEDLTEPFGKARELLSELTREITGKSYVGLTWYNDQLERTKEDMLALFDKAIERARGSEQSSVPASEESAIPPRKAEQA